MTTFAELNLDPQIMKALDACGYTIPTPIQSNSIPVILKGKDIVASARTGTGKTASFVLPALDRLCKTKPAGKPRILILTPTRELATQVTQAAAKYGKFLRFNIISLVGGMPYRQQLKELARIPDIIVATPGRLLDHMDNKRLDLSGIEMLVLDEADRMLDMGFVDDVKDISKATPKTRQTLLFSATVDDKLAGIVRQLLKDPTRVDLSEKMMAPTEIKQELYLADNAQHKMRLLQYFLDNENIFKAIIFSATKINADHLANQLCDKGYEAAALHGDLKQNVRNRTVEQLRRGKIQFLVATDIAARGIDISDVTHVINYDLPKFAEDYVHRIGRTGRAGKSGIAISLASPTDARHLQKIERFIGQRIHVQIIEGLEPTKRMGSASASENKRKGFGKSEGGYKKKPARGSYARNEEAARGGKRDDKGAYARKTDSAHNGRPFNKEHGDRKSARPARNTSSHDEGRESYARSSSSARGKSSEGRGGYERSESPRGKNSAGRESYARTSSPTRGKNSEGRGNYERSESPRAASREGRESYARSSSGTRSKSAEGRVSYERSESPRGVSREGRESYARSSSPYRGKSSEGRNNYERSESPRGKGGAGRESFARSSRPARGKSSEGRGSYERSESPRGKSGPGRESYAHTSSSARGKSSEGRGSYERDGSPRGKSSERKGGYARSEQSARPKSTDSRVSYGRSSNPGRGSKNSEGRSSANRGSFSRGESKRYSRTEASRGKKVSGKGAPRTRRTD